MDVNLKWTTGNKKYVYLAVVLVLVISCWVGWKYIHSMPVVESPQNVISASKDEVRNYKTAVMAHAEAAKEGSAKIYETEKSYVLDLAPSAVADGVMDELRIFSTEQSRSGDIIPVRP